MAAYSLGLCVDDGSCGTIVVDLLDCEDICMSSYENGDSDHHDDDTPELSPASFSGVIDLPMDVEDSARHLLHALSTTFEAPLDSSQSLPSISKLSTEVCLWDHVQLPHILDNEPSPLLLTKPPSFSVYTQERSPAHRLHRK